MNQYKIFRNSSGATEAVKQGWSWPAFFFPFWWALAKGLWPVVLALFLIGFVVGFITGGGQGGAVVIILFEIIARAIFGSNGNEWREKNLASRGFEVTGAVEAESPSDALALHAKPAGAQV